MLDHFFIDSFEGALHDTRKVNWHLKPLRPNYKRTHSDIKTTQDFKATLRNGCWAWPGGYPMFLLCSDGAALCFDCARKEARNIIDSIQRKARDGWQVVACDINYEDSDLYCDHCGKQIESAYGN